MVDYPSSLDTFTNPAGTNTLDSPSHSTQHINANDAIEVIESVLGTTSGTSVLKDFTSGDFPVRQKGGTVQGTINVENSTFGTPNITGGTLNTVTLNSPSINSPSISGSISGWTAVSETWTYASSDAPVYTWTSPGTLNTIYSKGMRVRFDQSGTTRYAILVSDPSVSSGTTTFTGYIGTAPALGTTAFSNIYYSTHKFPYGFPTGQKYWSVETTDTSSRTQSSPTQNTWYSLGSKSLTVPIGEWNLYYKVAAYAAKSNTTNVTAQVTLSTSGTSASNSNLTGWSEITVGSASTIYGLLSLGINEDISVGTKTPYYLITRTTVASASTLGNANDVSALVIRARSNLL